MGQPKWITNFLHTHQRFKCTNICKPTQTTRQRNTHTHTQTYGGSIARLANSTTSNFKDVGAGYLSLHGHHGHPFHWDTSGPLRGSHHTAGGLPELFVHRSWSSLKPVSIQCLQDSIPYALAKLTELAPLQCLQDSTLYTLAKLTKLAPLQCLQDSTCYTLAKLTELAPLQCLQDSTCYTLAKLTKLAPLQCLQDSTCYTLAKLTELAPLQCLQDSTCYTLAKLTVSSPSVPAGQYLLYPGQTNS